MSDSETLLKATLNRVAARIGKKMIHSAEELADIAQDAPRRIQEEWSQFKDEVIEESIRLEKASKTTSSKDVESTKRNPSHEDLIQSKIDNLRSKVMNINRNIEEKN